MPSYRQPPWKGPLAPLATLIVHGYILGKPTTSEITALLDSGADSSEIPNQLARNLSLRQRGEKLVSGIGESLKRYPTYLATVELDGRTFKVLVVGTDGLNTGGEERWAIVGRDILNQAVNLNGPQLTYDIV